MCRQLASVVGERLVCSAVVRDLSPLQHERPLADPFHCGRVVRDEDDRPAALAELRDAAEALALELLVPDREHLVEQQGVGLQERCDGEAEAHVHPGGVGAHGAVDGMLQLGEGDDLVEARGDLRAAQPLDRSVQEDVLAPGEVGVEAGAELEQAAQTPAGGDGAGGRPDDPGHDPQQRRLARAVSPDERHRLPRGDLERDVAKRPHLLASAPPPAHEQLLQRLRVARAHREAARDRDHGDRAWAHAGPPPPATSSTSRVRWSGSVVGSTP